MLGSDDMVLLVGTFCSDNTLDSMCATSRQELLAVLWVAMSKGRDGACAELAADAEFLRSCVAWVPVHEVRVPPRCAWAYCTFGPCKYSAMPPHFLCAQCHAACAQAERKNISSTSLYSADHHALRPADNGSL